MPANETTDYSGPLSNGEIAKGQIVTVLNFHPQQNQIVLNGEFVQTVEVTEPNTIQGIPLEVVAFNSPLIILGNVCDLDFIPTTIILDVRQVQLFELSKDYLKSFRQYLKKAENRNRGRGGHVSNNSGQSVGNEMEILASSEGGGQEDLDSLLRQMFGIEDGGQQPPVNIVPPPEPPANEGKNFGLQF